ncbi:uncharacterized protein LOC127002458 [Eriocheir sinensis]|uniref:uncharacterized protein LOC127002458 n=1 Tax=Eriocheir sinensis TaxID=95602 RepID=UPI0021C5B558|nr:uncharacterized protein LOC127002458 [Eriocheir sinensis]
MYKGIILYCSHALPVILPSLPCCRIMSEGGSRGDVAMRANENVHRSGITPEEMAAGYDEWSENYEKMMIWKGGYRGPAITLEEALRWVLPERRAKARVLDVAAGTGWGAAGPQTGGCPVTILKYPPVHCLLPASASASTRVQRQKIKMMCWKLQQFV